VTYVPGHGLPSSPEQQSRAIGAFAILAHQVDRLLDGWHLSSFYCPPNDVVELTVSLMPRRTAAIGKTMDHRPRASTALSHGHLCGSHALHRSLCATATLTSSSESLIPTEQARVPGVGPRGPDPPLLQLMVAFIHTGMC